MKILYAAFVFLVFGRFAGVLHGQVILQFEPPQYSTPDGGVEEAGFIFTAPKAPQFVNGGGLSFNDPSPGLGNRNGLNTVPYDGTAYAVAFTGSEPVLQQADGAPFELESMDLAAYSASFSDVNTVDITGYYATGGTVTTELVFDGTVNGEIGDFHTFVFGAQWNNLDQVVMFDSVPWASGVGFSIDNIAVSSAPEPGPLSFFGLAAFGLIFKSGAGANWGLFGRTRALK